MSGRYLGVDMGGSGTRAHLLGDAGGTREWRDVGGNLALDPEEALRVLVQIVAAARPDAACLGLAGARTAGTSVQLVRRELEELVPRVTIVPDAELAAVAAFGPVADGIVICAGTGSVAVVRVGGEITLVGGHGYLLDDAGGAYGIGRRGLVEALRERDRGVVELATAVEAAVGESLDRYVAKVYRNPSDRSLVASLAPIFSTLDHPTAHRLVDEAADALVELVEEARTRFAALPVRYTGGVFGIDAIASRLEHEFGATKATVRAEVAAARLARTAA